MLMNETRRSHEKRDAADDANHAPVRCHEHRARYRCGRRASHKPRRGRWIASKRGFRNRPSRPVTSAESVASSSHITALMGTSASVLRVLSDGYMRQPRRGAGARPESPASRQGDPLGGSRSGARGPGVARRFRLSRAGWLGLTTGNQGRLRASRHWLGTRRVEDLGTAAPRCPGTAPACQGVSLIVVAAAGVGEYRRILELPGLAVLPKLADDGPGRLVLLDVEVGEQAR
jgi:hypothetical protein